MDPAAKQVARGNKWTRAPQLGDLVLAKVKGYPFWPAKVSRPEDWNQEPAPRKFFVLFFGTREITFVALHDLLPFTEEVKSDLVNQAREKRFPKRHAEGLEKALVEVEKAYDELPKSPETSNGLFHSRAPDLIEKPTEPLVKPPADGGTPKLEQIDDFDGRHLSLKRKERDVPKSSETANGLLHDRTPDPIEKPTEPLVKPPTDGGTPKLEQIDDFDGRYLSLKRKEGDVLKSSETSNGLLNDRTPDPIEKPTEPLVKLPADGGTPKLEQTDDSHERYPSLKREKRVQFAGIEESNLEDPYGIPKCIAALEGLQDLQMEDVLKAADLFTDNKGNREVFLSFSSNAFRLGWVRRKIQNT
ncbi:hypothetical protein ACQJBY_069169 [Aegilops geniculata]